MASFFTQPGLGSEGNGVGTSILDGRTLAEVFIKRVQLSPNQRVYLIKTNGAYRPMTWGEVGEISLGVFASLRAAGIGKGDRVAILSNSRPEWAICDISIQTAGAVTVPIYQSSTAEDVGFVLEHSGAKLVFAEDASQAEKLKTIFAASGKTLPVVFFKPGVQSASFASRSFEEFAQVVDRQNTAREQAAMAESLTPQDLASIVYTSGTTGIPKGARLLHRCLISEIRSIGEEVALSSDDVMLTFLPFAHVLGRVESLIPLMTGISLAFAESVSSVVVNLSEVKPTLLISVPRIYEKIYAKIVTEAEGSPEYKKKLFYWSVKVGREVARLRSKKHPIPLALGLKYRLADQMVFSKVRQKLGGRIRLTVSGGAPLAPELCEFFHACGIKILEGYGLTETTAAIAVNRPEDYRFATVGRPLAGTHFRFANDGEIQVKGPAVFDGYHNDDSATQEALTSDGWFCTGDIGEIDDGGFVRITDRKKELIVTSGGKNIAPQKLENTIKAIPMVSQALVYGDKEKYLIALITLSECDVKRWARDQQIECDDMTALAKHPALNAHIEKGLKQMNRDLASYETVKKFKILPKDFSLEEGEMTPSLKLKRKVINQKYKEQIQSLY
jgi:long-chain acyl-CoA synthetase